MRANTIPNLPGSIGAKSHLQGVLFTFALAPVVLVFLTITAGVFVFQALTLLGRSPISKTLMNLVIGVWVSDLFLVCRTAVGVGDYPTFIGGSVSIFLLAIIAICIEQASHPTTQ